MNKVNVQHRVAPRPKQCPICKKPVTKADFDDKKTIYTHVPERKELGLRWQHLACKSACEFVERAAGRQPPLITRLTALDSRSAP